MKEYYFSVLIQDAETINEIRELREQFAENDEFNICAVVADQFECFSENADNFTDYKPFIGKNGDFVVATYREYTLVRNMSVCGDYMLYRKATETENEWLNDHNKETL